MDSKSIGLCPQGLESPRCRLLHHSGPLEPYPNPLSKPPGADILYVSGLATELRFSRPALHWTGRTPTSQLWAMCVGFGIGDSWLGEGRSTTFILPAKLSSIPTISAPTPRHCARAVKGMDSKSIGLCPQGFESPRCRYPKAPQIVAGCLLSKIQRVCVVYNALPFSYVQKLCQLLWESAC